MASTKKAAPVAEKTTAAKAPFKALFKTAAKKPAPAKKAAPPTWKPRKGETLEYTKRNGDTGSGKYVETVNYSKGDWYVLKVEKGRKPTANVRPSEARRPVAAAASAA